jgi:hypothetical protein
MWDKGSQVDEFFGELYRSFWRGDKTFPPQYAYWKILLGECCQIVAAQICTIKRKVVTFGVLHSFGLMVHIV